MHIFYSETIQNGYIILSDEETRHCTKVLRLGIGAAINCIDGIGNFYTAEITDITKRNVIARVSLTQESFGNHQFTVRMAVAPTKNIDRFEFFVEKAVELGVNHIIPILCDNSERKVVKTERLEKIVIAAMKQSYKATKPTIDEITPLRALLKRPFSGVRAIAHCAQGEKRSVKQFDKPTEITMLIGPEGDFSADEISLALTQGWIPFSLGNSRLRTETAAFAALHSVHLSWTDV
jgi:16S rRNA (uracil1498-N3)-methyltransferase